MAKIPGDDVPDSCDCPSHMVTDRVREPNEWLTECPHCREETEFCCCPRAGNPRNRNNRNLDRRHKRDEDYSRS